MKKALVIFAVIMAAAVAGLAVIVAMQPEDYSVTRSTRINAAPLEVHSHIEDFKRWDAWSPWAKLDPQMQTTITGPERGVGSRYEWHGNTSVGQGEMTIIESRPGENVKIDLRFTDPFEASSISEFTLRPDGDMTDVIWTTSGKNGFLAKAMCLVIDMDTMMGPDFERGLAQMKTVVEKDR